MPIYVLIPNSVFPAKELLENLSPFEQVQSDGGRMVVVNRKADTEKEDALKVHLAADGFYKCFEHCWIKDGNNEADKQKLVASFFSEISEKYDDEITQNNIACYEYFFDETRKRTNIYNSSFLDYGCGTGQILNASVHLSNERLLGFDLCSKMADVARKRGLSVISEDKFLLLSERMFDIIFSVYVLHFGISANQLSHLIGLLKDDGIFIANFHKNIGLENILKLMRTLSQSGFKFDIADSSFGSIIKIWRSH